MLRLPIEKDKQNLTVTSRAKPEIHSSIIAMYIFSKKRVISI